MIKAKALVVLSRGGKYIQVGEEVSFKDTEFLNAQALQARGFIKILREEPQEKVNGKDSTDSDQPGSDGDSPKSKRGKR